MGEEGLKAIHKITQNINFQDEKIWRQTATRKCLKKEIDKLEERTKHYEIQIATLKKNPLYKKREGVARMLEENTKEHVQAYKLLSLAIASKKEEVERRTKDIECWDKKYKEVIDDFKEAYDIKKELYGSTNPTYKKLMEINAAQKIAEVRLKQLKASSERRRRAKKQLEQIREKIFHKTIVNFVVAVIRKKKYGEVISKTKKLEVMKKKMVRDMFEAQEALTKLRVRDTQIPSDMFTRRVPILNLPGITNRKELNKIADSMQDINKLKRVNRSPINTATLKKLPQEMNSDKENTPPTPIKRQKLPSNKLNIISNKLIALPPLKTILSKQRSRLDTSNSSFCDVSFTRSQNSQIDPEKQPTSTPKSSQEEKDRSDITQNVQESNNNKPTLINVNKPSDCLKNLKFTSQTNKFQTPKPKSSPICSQNSQVNQMQKASILKSQVGKRKLNESLQDIDLDSSQRKKGVFKGEKNVNFASPIQQRIEIGQSCNEMSLNLSSNMNASGFLDENSTMISQNDAPFQMGSPPFSFSQSDNNQLGKNDGNGGHKMAPVSIFGDTKNTEPSFGFCFGGPSKTTNEMWDLFG